MPEGAVYVGRPTKYGNPFSVHFDSERGWVVESRNFDGTHQFSFAKHTEDEARNSAVRLYREWLLNDGSQPGAIRDDGGAFVLQMAKEELKGKDLACWCPLCTKSGLPVSCHADVLLELVNET